jgi:hypothetical protein
VVENVLLVETCKRYHAAPLDALQLKVGVMETQVALLVGEARVGDNGGATGIVKLHTGPEVKLPHVFLATIFQ